MRQLMTRLGLTVNETKTRLARLPEEHFDFLGYSVLQRHMERRSEWTDDCVVKLRER
jgi:hypothetical protein